MQDTEEILNKRKDEENSRKERRNSGCDAECGVITAENRKVTSFQARKLHEY